MARNAGFNVENSFIRGLVTEATGLNFPENAAVDESNCVFTSKGAVERRLGFDFEAGSSPIAVTRTGGAIVEYEWKAVAGLTAFSFFVLQIEDTIYFFEANEDGSLTENVKPFTIDLTTYQVPGSPSIATEPCSFSTGAGYLFIAHPYMTTIYVYYNAGDDDIETEVIDIRVRDFAGVPDSLEPDDRSGSLNNTRRYNLFNRGWYATVQDHNDAHLNLIDSWRTDRDDFPSYSDVWWLYKDMDEKFDASLVDKFAPTNSLAPAGHYIYSAFNLDRSAASGISGLPSETSSFYRPSTVAFFTGRVFYSGVKFRNYSNVVYFSPIIERPSQFGQCYQINDPTSEQAFDLLSSDGGTLIIPEAGTIFRLIPVEGSLLVFASNGIWAISGNQGVSFAANDFSVRTVARISLTGAMSFVDVDGFPMWWAEGGIYAITGGDQLGNVQLTNLTDTSIKSYYEELPSSAKAYAKGAYNFVDKIVQWVYRTSEPETDLDKFHYDTVLSFNVLTRAFYRWSISPGPLVAGITTTRGLGARRLKVNVVDSGGNQVITSGGDLVISHQITAVPLPSSTRYTTLIPGENPDEFFLTFSLVSSDTYRDWPSINGGTDYQSYFVTGYKVHGEGSKKFQSNYVTVFSNAHEDGSAYLQGVWNWSNSNDGFEQSVKQQVYVPKPRVQLIARRLKVRGHGLALQLKLSSETGKPFSIVGWSIFETGNAGV